ncbi:MAG: hypothetical protein K6C10_04105 [Prevotella sp.]|nr:hypothetical protein [Prevotella sp.]
MKSFGTFLLTVLFVIFPPKAEAQTIEYGGMQYGVKVGTSAGIHCTERHIDVSAGWRFNRKHYLGIGTGYQQTDITDDADPTNGNGKVAFIPLYADYTYYLPFNAHSNDSFLLGVEAGGGYYPDKTPCKENYDNRFSPIIKAKIGLDFHIVKTLNLNVALGVLISDVAGIGIDIGATF